MSGCSKTPVSSSKRPPSRIKGQIIAWTFMLSMVAQAENVARAETDDVPLGRGIEVRDLTVDPDHRLEDARGLKIVLRYRVGTVDSEKALHLIARVFTKAGHKVASISKSASLRDGNDGSLHAKKQLITVPRRQWRDTSLFIPFYTMKLAPGAHQVKLELSAVSDPGQCKTGERPRLVRIIGERQISAEITKPPYKTVQLLVRSASVVEQASDVSLWPWRAAPDLRWRLRIRAGAGGVLHSSKVKANTYSASWDRYSPPFPLSQGDLLTLGIIDQDVMSHDDLGAVKLSLDDLISLRDRPRPLKAGKVTSIVLGNIKVR